MAPQRFQTVMFGAIKAAEIPTRSLGIAVAAVDYRLAPEHPAALDDCDAALMWLAELPTVDAERIAIGGAEQAAD